MPVIEKAKEACKNSRQDIHTHFVDTNEMVKIGTGAERSVDTVMLSRYACYLIIQNSDPSREVVAMGQTYFAIQTRRQEVSDILIEDNKRVVLRGEIKNITPRLRRLLIMPVLKITESFKITGIKDFMAG